MAELGIYAGLFLVAFLAATVVPAQSELGLAGLVMSGEHSVVLLVAVARAGNILGAVVNWGLGRGIERFAGRLPGIAATVDGACCSAGRPLSVTR